MHDVQFYLEEFYPFAKEALGFDQDATIVFESDFSNAKNPLGKTAHYDPTNSTVTVYVDKRHPKDVMRSVSHELVHHAQNVRGDLQRGSMEEGYAQNDDHLREMEKEAYTKGNMLFRDWTDSRNNPNNQKDIMARIMQEWGYDEAALTEEGGGFEEGQLVKVVASALAVDGEKNGTVVSYEDPAVTIKLDDDQEGKYVPDDKMVKVKKDYVEPRAEAGFDDVMGEGGEGVDREFNVGDEIIANGYPGYITDLSIPGMATVKLGRGETTVSLKYVHKKDDKDNQMSEMYDDDDFGDDDLDMAALEKEFPWLAKDVKTREAPPEVAADLADEFGNKGEPEDEEEPLDEGGKRWADYGTSDAETGRPPSPPMERTNPTGYNEYMEAYMMAMADAKAKQGTWHDDEHETLADRKFTDSMREKLSDEEEKEITAKMSNKEFVKYMTHDKHVVPNLKGDMGEIPGMEGPFQYKSGAVLYYDPKEGKYYDRGKDMYIDHEEASRLIAEDDFDLFEPEGFDSDYDEEIVTLVHVFSGKEIAVDAFAAEEKLATGEWELVRTVDEEAVLNLEMSDTGSAEGDEAGNCEAKGGKWDPAQGKCVYEEKNIIGDNEMNIEEIVRAAVRRALKEKKYRREDVGEEAEEKNEAHQPWRGKRTMADLDKDAKTRETDHLKKDDDKKNVEEATEETTEETVTEGNFAEYGKIDAEDGNPPSKIGRGDEAYMAAYNDVLIARGEEPLDIQKPDQAYLDALGRGQLSNDYAKREELSAGQEELDLDDDGKIEPSDFAGLRAGKTDDEVGEEAEEKEKKDESLMGEQSNPLEWADTNGLSHDVDNDHNIIVYATEEQANSISLPPGSEEWSVERDNDGGYIIYTNQSVVTMKEDTPTPVALKGPFDPSQIQSVEDPEYGGLIHTLPNVELTGDLEQDVYDMIGGDEELYSWLWGEMESGDSITDAAGQHVYSGSDVQDVIKAHEESGPGGSHHYQENISDKEWYDSKLFESLKRNWAK